MWNTILLKQLEKEKDIILQYNLLQDPLVGKTVILKNNLYKINNIFREWKDGWFYSMELIKDPNDTTYYKIPFKNINSENSEILERIKIIQDLIEIQE